MKKIVLLISFVTVVTNAQWHQQASNTINNLNDVCFIDVNYGVVCGSNGIILTTTNGGVNWIARESGVNVNLRSCFMINSLTSVIVGENKILRTTNGGELWEVKTVSGYSGLGSVCFFNSNTGLVVGGSSARFKTTNSGLSWIDLSLPHPFSNYTMIVKYNDSTLFGVGSMFVIHLGSSKAKYWFTNFGENVIENGPWSQGTWWHTNFSGSTGFITGGGEDYYSLNGGNTWNLSPVYLGILSFINETSGYRVHGDIFYSTDRGISWIFDYHPDDYILVDIQMVTDKIVTCVGRDGIIYRNNNSLIGINSSGNEIPELYYLYQNHPNPFNPTTKIKFSIPAAERYLDLRVYNVLGEVLLLERYNNLNPGTYEFDFDGTKYSSGIYFYSISTSHFRETKKMILLK